MSGVVQRLLICAVLLYRGTMGSSRILNAIPEDIGDHKRHISLTHISDYLITLHNSFRRLAVMQHVGNMRRTSWSNNLAQEASVQSTSCDTTYKTEKYGYNYAVEPKTDLPPGGDILIEMIEKMMYEWSKESFDIFKPCHGDCNNFTQMIWYSTTEFGCALHTCTKLSLTANKRSLDNVYLFVCMYYDKGNIEGQAPATYSQKPCSLCSETEHCDQGLCYQDECVNNHLVGKQCEDWAERGFCEESATWMSKHCKQSCRLCGVACEDKKEERFCRLFRSQFGCFRNKEFGQKHCRKTCNMCKADKN